jgi:hypothetical protein
MAGDPPPDQVVTKTLEAARGAAAKVSGTWACQARNDETSRSSPTTRRASATRNFGETRRRGGELGVRGRAGKFTLGANYSFLDAIYRTRSG